MQRTKKTSTYTINRKRSKKMWLGLTHVKLLYWNLLHVKVKQLQNEANGRLAAFNSTAFFTQMLYTQSESEKKESRSLEKPKQFIDSVETDFFFVPLES